MSVKKDWSTKVLSLQVQKKNITKYSKLSGSYQAADSTINFSWDHSVLLYWLVARLIIKTFSLRSIVTLDKCSNSSFETFFKNSMQENYYYMYFGYFGCNVIRIFDCIVLKDKRKKYKHYNNYSAVK